MEVVILQDAKEIGGVAADAIGALLSRKLLEAGMAGHLRRHYVDDR
jgi:hypothetical protein